MAQNYRESETFDFRVAHSTWNLVQVLTNSVNKQCFQNLWCNGKTLFGTFFTNLTNLAASAWQKKAYLWLPVAVEGILKKNVRPFCFLHTVYFQNISHDFIL